MYGVCSYKGENATAKFTVSVWSKVASRSKVRVKVTSQGQRRSGSRSGVRSKEVRVKGQGQRKFIT